MPAFVFPGQGSQRPGMGRPWTDHPSWEVVDDASEAAGRDIGRLLLDAPLDELTETRNAQLATFTFSLLVIDAIERLGIEPTGVAGHSVGEYSALAASGALGFEDGVRVVAERGEAMQAAADAQPGVMTVIPGCDADTVDIACRLADGEVWVANFNSAEETVIAGEPDAVARAGACAMELGARKVSPVAVGGAFHTPFMARPATGCARFWPPSPSTRPRSPSSPTSTPGSTRPPPTGSCCCPPSWCSPIRWRQSILRLGGLLEPRHRRRAPVRGARARRLPLDHGPPHPAQRVDRGRVGARPTWTAWWTPSRATPPCTPTPSAIRASTSMSPSGW